MATEEAFNVYAPTTLGVYTDSACTTLADQNASFEENKYYIAEGGGSTWKDFDTIQLPSDARREPSGGPIPGVYYIKLSLENDSTKEAEMPVKGDKIGTVTISIDAE